MSKEPFPERNAAIRRMRQAGVTLQEIGDAFGLTRERVRQISRGTPGQPTQDVRRKNSMQRKADKAARWEETKARRKRERIAAEEVGASVRAARMAEGLSGYRLSKMLGWHWNQLAHLERGRARKSKLAEMLTQIASILPSLEI